LDPKSQRVPHINTLPNPGRDSDDPHRAEGSLHANPETGGSQPRPGGQHPAHRRRLHGSDRRLLYRGPARTGEGKSLVGLRGQVFKVLTVLK